jgi:hypothetical protein
MISQPNLDRRLSSQVIVFELGMLITGTYFGTQKEFAALQFEKRLGKNASVKIQVFNNWLGAVSHWAETEALKIVGGIVSCRASAQGAGSLELFFFWQPSPFYSKSLNFRPDTLIPYSGIRELFRFFDKRDKGTLVSLSSPFVGAQGEGLYSFHSTPLRSGSPSSTWKAAPRTTSRKAPPHTPTGTLSSVRSQLPEKPWNS